jgi:hypothetical protein
MLKKNNQYQWTPGAATAFHTLQDGCQYVGTEHGTPRNKLRPDRGD